MSDVIKHTITWQPSHNNVTIDAFMDVRVHKLESDTVVIILPGVDGSVDGYENKYVKMAENIVDGQRKSVVRVSNNFVSSFHWEDNFRRTIDYISDNSKQLFDKDEVTLEVVAHSAGASVVAWIAWEYPQIKKVVLINTAAQLKPERIIDGLKNYKNTAHIVYGSRDPSLAFLEHIPSRYSTTTIDGADHFFSDEHLETFISLTELLSD